MGVDPGNAGSEFKIKSIVSVEGKYELRWESVASRQYRVLASTTLNAPWLPVSDLLPGTGSELVFTEPISETRIFYRVEVSVP